jgi:TolB-like protein
LNPANQSVVSTQPKPGHLRLRPLVALLPFTPAGGDEALRLLSSEIADLLRERIAADPALRAILISSDFLAKAPPHAIELVCRELRVGHLITGRCHGSGADASLYVELADTREWYVRWAHFYRGTARSLLDSRSDAMTGLVAALRRTLVEHPWR